MLLQFNITQFTYSLQFLKGDVHPILSLNRLAAIASATVVYVNAWAYTRMGLYYLSAKSSLQQLQTKPTGSYDPRIYSHSGVVWQDANQPVLLRRRLLQSYV